MWVDQITELIEKQQTRVILVGHSRGGIIISEVAQRVPDKIKLLVYLTAYLLPSGETIAQLQSHVRGDEVYFQHHSDGTITLKPDKIAALFYNTTSPEWVERAPEMLSPEPVNVFATPLQLTDDRFGRVPRAYIECTEDRAILPELQRLMQKELPCKYVMKMNTDHSPFFSAPSELAAHLLELASKV